jgi:hypothetical protein
MSTNPFFTNEEAARRGQEASRMLESDVFKDAVAFAERELVKEWLETPNADVQRMCWAKVHALKEVKLALLRIVSDGDVAKHLIEQANQ